MDADTVIIILILPLLLLLEFMAPLLVSESPENTGRTNAATHARAHILSDQPVVITKRCIGE